MKKTFEQRPEMQVAKCPIIHVLSSGYNVSRLKIQNKRKATQQWSFCVANDIVLNQVKNLLKNSMYCLEKNEQMHLKPTLS